MTNEERFKRAWNAGPTLDYYTAMEAFLKEFAEKDAEKDLILLQIDEWRKNGAALRDEMRERLAREGLEMSDTPKSHYSPACNRLLELLRG
jgi:hypothetical protein